MQSQEVYYLLNRARIHLIHKKDWDAVDFLDEFILKHFCLEQEKDFARTLV